MGIGVDPNTISFGTMINAARMELAREPMVWWSLVAAFIFMFVLVLAANLFADVVRTPSTRGRAELQAGFGAASWGRLFAGLLRSRWAGTLQGNVCIRGRAATGRSGG